MTENNFWEMLDKLDWTHEGDDEKVMEPVKNALAQLSDEDIFEFDNIMSSKLYDLDSRERAQKLYGTLEHFSADTFLYNRCVAIVNGKEYYEDILNQRQQLNPDLEFESILYLPALAWAQKHHVSMDEYPHVPERHYESGCNNLLWCQWGEI